MNNVDQLTIKIIDKVERQVQHCLRDYKGDELEDKLIEVVKKWFFDGFFGGMEYTENQYKKQQDNKQ